MSFFLTKCVKISEMDETRNLVKWNAIFMYVRVVRNSIEFESTSPWISYKTSSNGIIKKYFNEGILYRSDAICEQKDVWSEINFQIDSFRLYKTNYLLAIIVIWLINLKDEAKCSSLQNNIILFVSFLLELFMFLTIFSCSDFQVSKSHSN